MVFLNKGKLICDWSVISEKRGILWNSKNQHFRRNRGSFKVKSAVFATWRTLMGYTNFP